MRKQNGFITEKNNFIKKLFFMTAKAEEGTQAQDPKPQEGEPTTPTQEPSQPTSTTSSINYEDLIARARQQEKDKLYPQIKKLEEEKKALIEKNNANLLSLGEKDSEITALKKEIETLKSKGASSEEKRLLSENDDLKKKLAELEANTISREEIEKEIKAEYEVKLYREQKLREVGDTVIPELVTGATKEEIDNSIKNAQERFNQIQEKILGSTGRVPLSNTSVSSFQNANISLEDIAKLDPSSPEYAQLRVKLGLR